LGRCEEGKEVVHGIDLAATPAITASAVSNNQNCRGGRLITDDERSELAEKFLPSIRRIAKRMILAGQRPPIEYDELVSVGYYSLARNLERGDTDPFHVLRNAKSFMLSYVYEDRRHWTSRNCCETLPDPQQQYDREERRLVDGMTILVSLEQLPSAHRSAFILCEIDGYTQEEAAAELKVTQQCVCQWLEAAKQKLAKLIC
jgi:RNA polymerase sigma factor (sigma-70 family)